MVDNYPLYDIHVIDSLTYAGDKKNLGKYIDKITFHKQLRKLNPKDSTLEWQEFGKDKERYFTNKQKADDLQNYIKKTFKINLK